MTVVVGVDASSTRLIAVVVHPSAPRCPETYETIVLDRMPTDAPGRCLAALQWGHSVATTSGAGFVLVEAPFFHPKHPTGGIGISQVNGALMAGLMEGMVNTAGVETVPVSTWKANIVGSGNANKDAITAYVLDKCPTYHQYIHTTDTYKKVTQDCMDAWCIAQHAKSVLELRGRVNRLRARRQEGK